MYSQEGGPLGLQVSDCIALSFSAKVTQICRDAVKFTHLVGYCEWIIRPIVTYAEHRLTGDLE